MCVLAHEGVDTAIPGFDWISQWKSNPYTFEWTTRNLHEIAYGSGELDVEDDAWAGDARVAVEGWTLVAGSFALAMSSLIVAASAMAWIKMGNAAAAVTSIFGILFLALVWKHQQMKKAFRIDPDEMVQGDVRLQVGVTDVDVSTLEAGFGGGAAGAAAAAASPNASSSNGGGPSSDGMLLGGAVHEQQARRSVRRPRPDSPLAPELKAKEMPRRRKELPPPPPRALSPAAVEEKAAAEAKAAKEAAAAAAEAKAAEEAAAAAAEAKAAEAPAAEEAAPETEEGSA